MFIRSAALSATLIFAAGPVYASQGKVLLEEIVALAGVNGTKITWGSLIEENNSSFALQNVEIVDKKGKITTINNVVVRGLEEANGRMTYDSFTMNDLRETDGNEGLGIANITSSSGDWPSNIWDDGLTAEEKRQRITFGNFSVNGLAAKREGVNFTLNSILMTNADIPLDYRFDPKQIEEAQGEPAAPLTFDQFAVVGLNGNGQGVNYQMGSFTLNNVNFPTSVNANISDWMRVFSSFSVNGIKASLAQLPVFALDNYGGTISPPGDSGNIVVKTNLDGLMINLKAVPDPKFQAIAGQLGYDQINGSMASNGSYNPSTGRTAIFDTVLKLKDMFDLSLDYAITGYTPEVAGKFADAQMKMAQGGDRSQMLGAMATELSGVKLESFGLSLTDHSLVGRLLDFQASQMGTTGDQLAAGAPMMIGMGMGALNMPALTEMVTSAVGKFLTEKGTLTVRAMPTEPVSIVNVVLTGQRDPTKIPDMVNLQVSAQ